MHNNRHRGKNDDEYNKCIEFIRNKKKIIMWIKKKSKIGMMRDLYAYTNTYVKRRIPTAKSETNETKHLMLFLLVSLCVSRLLNSINYRELWLCQRFWIRFNQVIFIEFEILKKMRTISNFPLSSIIMISFFVVVFFLFQYTLPCIKDQNPIWLTSVSFQADHSVCVTNGNATDTQPSKDARIY